MNQIEEKVGKESFIEKKWERGEHFKMKLPTPNWEASNFISKCSCDLWKNKYVFGSVVQIH